MEDRQTDGRTDGQTDRILIARPRLHFMQRGNKSGTNNTQICRMLSVSFIHVNDKITTS